MHSFVNLLVTSLYSFISSAVQELILNIVNKLTIQLKIFYWRWIEMHSFVNLLVSSLYSFISSAVQELILNIVNKLTIQAMMKIWK